MLSYTKKEEEQEDWKNMKEKKDNSSTDENPPKLEVEINVDGKEEGEEEIHPHMTVYWNEPRRLVNQ